jgi:hypothetical protein
MTVSKLKLKISTPTGPIAPGRGFYQLEEDALYVQVGPFSRSRRFFSYLESNRVSLSFDKTGRLTFIEINLPRRRWQVTGNLNRPDMPVVADIRWLDFRDRIPEPAIQTNFNLTAVRISFSDNKAVRSCYLGEQVIIGLDRDDSPVSIWIDEIIDDLAGREISAFRKANRNEPLLAERAEAQN